MFFDLEAKTEQESTGKLLKKELRRTVYFCD
jgi:hypothetical protein